MKSGWTSTSLTVNELIDRGLKDETLCWDKRAGPDPGDERVKGPPCHGDHDWSQHNCRNRNQHALSLKCWKCQVCLLYVPVRGSNGDTRKPSPLDHQTTAPAVDNLMVQVKAAA